MKKFAIFVASLMLLSGCSAVSDTVKTEEKPETNTEQDMPEKNDGQGKTEETASEMYIEQAQLNEDEKNILSLMDVKNNGVICDFAVDENVESVHITVYKYKDGEWKEYTRDSRLFSDTEGRIGLAYEDMGNGMKTSFQSEHDKGSNEFYPDTEDVYSTGRMQTTLNTRTSVKYNEEIPVGIQVYTGDKGPSSVSLESFYEPETLNGCEAAYAVTVEFSDLNLDEHRKMEESEAQMKEEPVDTMKKEETEEDQSAQKDQSAQSEPSEKSEPNGQSGQNEQNDQSTAAEDQVQRAL